MSHFLSNLSLTMLLMLQRVLCLKITIGVVRDSNLICSSCSADCSSDQFNIDQAMKVVGLELTLPTDGQLSLLPPHEEMNATDKSNTTAIFNFLIFIINTKLKPNYQIKK